MEVNCSKTYCKSNKKFTCNLTTISIGNFGQCLELEIPVFIMDSETKEIVGTKYKSDL